MGLASFSLEGHQKLRAGFTIGAKVLFSIIGTLVAPAMRAVESRLACWRP